MSQSEHKSEPRQRIIETADRLFYQEGIRAVGIDRIVSEADVAKMSLYKHFRSKDDLIFEVLHYREQAFVESITAAMEKHKKQQTNRLQAFFAALGDIVKGKGFRGCPFQNAAVELADPDHAAVKFVREQKRRFASVLREIILESYGKRADPLVPMIFLLVEGAVMTAAIEGNPTCVAVARDAAMRLLATRDGKSA